MEELILQNQLVIMQALLVNMKDLSMQKYLKEQIMLTKARLQGMR
jgi:hypothetical protein